MKNKTLLLIVNILFIFFSCSSNENKIFQYIKDNNINNIEKQIKNNANLVDIENDDKSTLLHIACLYGNLEISITNRKWSQSKS